MKRTLKLMVLAVLVGWMAIPVFATALTEARNTPARDGARMGIGVYTNVQIFAGAMVCVNSSGYAVPAADTASYAVIGRARTSVDTRLVPSGEKTIEVDRGVFRWENADTILDSDIGKICYVTDDQTVNKTGGGNNVIAGAIVDVDDLGVWVDTGKVGPIGAATPSSLAVSGAATVGTTLAVTGASTLGSTVEVTGAQTNSSTLKVNGAVSAYSTLAVTGAATLSSTLDVTGAARIGVQTTYSHTVGDLTLTSAYYGKCVLVATNGATTITLPANGAAAGSMIDFLITGTDAAAPTVAAATADTLRGPNDVDLDSITFGTGHRIGAYFRVISDGSYWTAVNLGTTTMTGND